MRWPVPLRIGEKGRFDTSDGTINGTPNNSSHTLVNRPATSPSIRRTRTYIADGYGNRRVVVFDKGGNYLRQWGEQATLAQAQAGVGGKFLQVVHVVNIGHDGLVYVNDRKGNRIQVFEKDGTFIRNSTGTAGPATWPASSPTCTPWTQTRRAISTPGRPSVAAGCSGPRWRDR